MSINDETERDTDRDALPEGEPPRRREPPVFNLPAPVTLAIGLCAFVYALQSFGPIALADWITETFGFIPLRYVMSGDFQGLEWLWSPVTYSLLHGGIEHILFNCLWLAAFGAPVARRLGTGRFVVFWIFSAAFSAFFFAALHWGELTILVGASGVISALMGAAVRFAFPPAGEGYTGPLAHLNPRLSIPATFRSRTATVFTLMWLAGNLLLVTGLFGGPEMAGAIAWEAHIGGFLFGFVLLPLFDRDPLRRSL